VSWLSGRGDGFGELPVQACEYCFGLCADALAGGQAGLPSQADDPLDLVRQAEHFGVAKGGAQHGDCSVLVSCLGQHVGSGNPLDDAPLRSRWPVTGHETFRKGDGLTSAAGGEKPADADLPDSERVEQHFVPFGIFQGPNALLGNQVEQFGPPALGGSASEQDQAGTPAGGVVINLEGLLEPRNTRCDMPGLAEFVAVHSQNGRKQRPVAEAPGDAQRAASPQGGSGQLFLGQQMPESDSKRHPRLGQQSHGLRLDVPRGHAGF